MPPGWVFPVTFVSALHVKIVVSVAMSKFQAVVDVWAVGLQGPQRREGVDRLQDTPALKQGA